MHSVVPSSPGWTDSQAERNVGENVQKDEQKRPQQQVNGQTPLNYQQPQQLQQAFVLQPAVGQVLTAAAGGFSHAFSSDGQQQQQQKVATPFLVTPAYGTVGSTAFGGASAWSPTGTTTGGLVLTPGVGAAFLAQPQEQAQSFLVAPPGQTQPAEAVANSSTASDSGAAPAQRATDRPMVNGAAARGRGRGGRGRK